MAHTEAYEWVSCESPFCDRKHVVTREGRQHRVKKSNDCSCCGMDFYRTADGGCTFCAGGKQVCCRN